MTEEQKEILIGKMLNRPSSLSDEEVDAILHDEELRDIYEASAAVSSVYARPPEFDMDDEWTRFRPLLRRKSVSLRWTMRVVAVFLGAILAMGFVGKIIDNIISQRQHPAMAVVEKTKTPVNPHANQPDRLTAEAKYEIRDEDTTPESRSTIRRHQAAKTDIVMPEAVDKEEVDIDIDEYLRIQQAQIDNDLAMHIAESYLELYDDILPILYAVNAHNEEMDETRRKVTME